MPNIYRVNNLDENEKRGGNSLPPPSKKKKNFKTLKNNTIKSLNDVEYFLNNLNKFKRFIKLHKILK